MKYHQLVVIRNHATYVDLLMMPERKVVQQHDRPAGTKKLFSVMTYHLLVVIQNHATYVGLLMMPEHKVVQHHDLLQQ